MPPRMVVLALHYQNEIVHPEGRLRLGIAAASDRVAIIAAGRRFTRR